MSNVNCDLNQILAQSRLGLGCGTESRGEQQPGTRQMQARGVVDGGDRAAVVHQSGSARATCHHLNGFRFGFGCGLGSGFRLRTLVSRARFAYWGAKLEL